MLPLSPRICQCMRQFFVKRPTFLAETSNLRVEQNLVHLGRFLHFSQKVVESPSMNFLDKDETTKLWIPTCPPLGALYFVFSLMSD